MHSNCKTDMAILKFVTRDLRMSAIPLKSNGPGVDVQLGLLKQVGRETVTLLSPYGGSKDFSRHYAPTKAALSLVFKKLSFQSMSPFLDLSYDEELALELLSLVRFHDGRIPFLGMFVEAISHFLRYAAATMLNGGNRRMRITMILTAPGATCWQALDEPPLRASETALMEVAKMHATQESGSCVICCEDYAGGVMLPCGHGYHQGCIALWLDTSQSCPLCRCPLSST